MTKGKKDKKGFGDNDIGTKYGRSDLARMGLFSEAQYVSSGESYNSKKNATSLDYRVKGKQFLTAPPRLGHDSKESYFDREFIRLFENEPYTDLVVLRRRWRLQAKEKNITNVPFKPSSVPPKPSGKGSHWGTIDQQWPLESKGFTELPPKKAEEVKKAHELCNFLTSPPKKGSGYGYPNVTIGKPHQYESDPYDRAEHLNRSEREENKKKMVGERPFVSSSSNHEYFNSFAGISVSKGEKGGRLGQKDGAGSLKKSPLPSIPFKPTSCCGTTINPYPSYETPKGVTAVDEKTVKNVEGAPPRREMIFKPSGVTGSYPIRSIIEVSCPLAPPKWIQDSLSAAIMTISGP